MKQFARALAIAAALSVGVLTSEAQAGPITLSAGTQTTFTVDWSKLVNGVNLAALGLFTVTVNESGDWASFVITLTNNTTVSSNELLHGLGFDIDPNATGLSDPKQGSVFEYFSITQFPLLQTVDICAYSTISCAAGLPSANLAGGGASDTFGFTLQGNFDQGVALNNFRVTFQKGFTRLDTLTGTARTVPEYQSSASFLLVGLGFVVALGGWRRVTERPLAG